MDEKLSVYTHPAHREGAKVSYSWIYIMMPLHSNKDERVTYAEAISLPMEWKKI